VHVGVEIGPHSLVAMRIGQRPRWAVCAGWGRRPGNGGLDQQRQELAVDSVAAGKGGGGGRSPVEVGRTDGVEGMAASAPGKGSGVCCREARLPEEATGSRGFDDLCDGGE
jgi:hypothetical protein